MAVLGFLRGEVFGVLGFSMNTAKREKTTKNRKGRREKKERTKVNKIHEEESKKPRSKVWKTMEDGIEKEDDEEVKGKWVNRRGVGRLGFKLEGMIK